MSGQKELFLDILTKEEKEALLNKKLEEIRKKNEAIQKRHKEIEEDKKRAEIIKGAPAAVREKKTVPSDGDRDKRQSWPLPKSGGMGRGKPSAGRGKDKQPRPAPVQGPPPDPSFNFLADRRRDGGSDRKEKPEREKELLRRHPKNFGGQDFSNVKVQMRENRNRQDKERVKSGPPRTKREMEMVMTGRERRQYIEWHSEREKLDKERIERQKLATGEWRREWDKDKHFQDFDDAPKRTEPAKRPAGRIGSGRFDHSEREERHKVEASGPKAGVITGGNNTKKPVGRGRARGRGQARGRGDSGDKSPRPRTHSGSEDGRRVEQQHDSLVVKIDNSSQEPDETVEVEYWDDPVANQESATSHHKGSRSTRAPKLQAGKSHVDSRFQNAPEDGDNSEKGEGEEWEDCPEGDGGREAGNKPLLKLDCSLNPDAPIFTPFSPNFMTTPPDHVKVADWVKEVAANLSSPTSPRSDISYGLSPSDHSSQGEFSLSSDSVNISSTPKPAAHSLRPPRHCDIKSESVTADSGKGCDLSDSVGVEKPVTVEERETHMFQASEISETDVKVDAFGASEEVETSEPQDEPPISSGSGAEKSLSTSETQEETEEGEEDYEEEYDEEEYEEDEEEENEEQEDIESIGSNQANLAEVPVSGEQEELGDLQPGTFSTAELSPFAAKLDEPEQMAILGDCLEISDSPEKSPEALLTVEQSAVEGKTSQTGDEEANQNDGTTPDSSFLLLPPPLAGELSIAL